MVTNLIEEGKIKCDPYFPSGDSEAENEIIVPGNFHIRLESKRQENEFLVVRILSVHNLSTGQIRRITHYHGEGWPDRGVPDENSTEFLISFIKDLIK